MPKRFSINDTLIGEVATADDGRTGYVLSVSSSGTGGTGTSAQAVQGSSASGATDSGNGVKVSGVYLSPLPTFTSGQRGDLQIGTRGSLNVTLFTADSNVSVAFGVNNADGVAVSAATNNLSVMSRNTTFNGTSWDRQRKASLFPRVASSVAAGNPAVRKASAGDVKGFWGQNGAAITYLQIYNKATAPVIGTDTPVLTFPIPANASFSQMIPNDGAYFSTGIAYAFTTDAAGATGSAAAAVTAFNMLLA